MAKKLSDNKLIEKKQETEEVKRRKRKTNTIITVTAILVVIAIVVSVGYYLIYAMPMQRTIIRVNDENIKINYFLKRCLLNSTDDVYSMITNIVYELMIKQAAPEYGIVISETEIDEALMTEAKGSNDSISDAEYQEWYRQQLYTSMLSDKEFRDVIRNSLIAQKLQTYLQDNLPTTADQVHLHYIYLADYATATAIKERLDNGEDFATIAREVSLDSAAQDDNGDKGWMPIHALSADLEYAVTNLTIGQVSDPILLNSSSDTSSTSSSSSTTDGPYALIMISERATAMEVSDTYMAVLKGRALDDWLSARSATQTIKFFGKGSSGGYDSETNAWLQYQLAKMKKAAGITETTTTTNTTTTQ